MAHLLKCCIEGLLHIPKPIPEHYIKPVSTVHVQTLLYSVTQNWEKQLTKRRGGCSVYSHMPASNKQQLLETTRQKSFLGGTTHIFKDLSFQSHFMENLDKWPFSVAKEWSTLRGKIWKKDDEVQSGWPHRMPVEFTQSIKEETLSTTTNIDSSRSCVLADTPHSWTATAQLSPK